jgi:hypothetical protein
MRKALAYAASIRSFVPLGPHVTAFQRRVHQTAAVSSVGTLSCTCVVTLSLKRTVFYFFKYFWCVPNHGSEGHAFPTRNPSPSLFVIVSGATPPFQHAHAHASVAAAAWWWSPRTGSGTEAKL